MSGKLYKFFRARPTAAWYELSETEQNDLMAKNQADLEKRGIKPIVVCDAIWSSEQWVFFGVEEYPDMDVVQAHADFLTGIDWFKYIEAEIMLGTEWQNS